MLKVIIYFKITSNSYIDEVKENGVQTVGKVVKFTGMSRKPALYFIFYQMVNTKKQVHLEMIIM